MIYFHFSSSVPRPYIRNINWNTENCTHINFVLVNQKAALHISSSPGKAGKSFLLKTGSCTRNSYQDGFIILYDLVILYDFV